MWNLKKKNGTNEPIYKTEMESPIQKTNLRLPGGKWGRRGIKWDIGIDIYTLLYIKQTSNKTCCITQETLLNTL